MRWRSAGSAARTPPTSRFRSSPRWRRSSSPGCWDGAWRADAPACWPGLDLSQGLFGHLAFYPREMFGAPLWGARPFGYLFYAAAAALGYARWRRLPGSGLPAGWLVGVFVLLEFLPNRIELPYEPIP